MESFLLYDTSKPSPSLREIVIWTCATLIISNLIFVVLCTLLGVNSQSSIKKEKETEYTEWKKRGISPWSLAVSELLNSTIYAPVAEEVTFRLVLMKIICIQKLQLDPTLANIIQASVFGIMHLSNNVYTTQSKTYTNLQTLSAFISGLVSGYVYIKCNSLIPSLLAHIINNGAAGLSEVIGYIKYRHSHSAD